MLPVILWHTFLIKGIIISSNKIKPVINTKSNIFNNVINGVINVFYKVKKENIYEREQENLLIRIKNDMIKINPIFSQLKLTGGYFRSALENKETIYLKLMQNDNYFRNYDTIIKNCIDLSIGLLINKEICVVCKNYHFDSESLSLVEKLRFRAILLDIYEKHDKVKYKFYYVQNYVRIFYFLFKNKFIWSPNNLGGKFIKKQLLAMLALPPVVMELVN
jgi:hypothetical protein